MKMIVMTPASPVRGLRHEVNSDQLPGHEPDLHPRVVDERLVCASRLLDQAGAPPAPVSQRAHHERR